MRKILSALLACWLLCAAAMAEAPKALPVAVLDFGDAAEVWEEQSSDTIEGKSYIIGDWYVVLASELGEYSAEELARSLGGELPEDAAVMEAEDGRLQRASCELSYADAVLDVTAIWKNGCTVYLAVMAADVALETVVEQADAWLAELTIDGMPAITQPAGAKP